MHNAKNTSNSNLGNHYNKKAEPSNQQQQKSTNQQSVNKGPITRGSRSQSQQQIQTLEPNIVKQSPEVQPPPMQDNQNIMTKLETNQSVEGLNEEKPDIKWPPKRKLNKKEQKRRLNARIRRLVCPKSPLMVFSELYKDVPIKLDKQIHGNCVIFTATIEIDGQVYTGDHVSKSQAKQKACEHFLRFMLSKKISEQTSSSDKKEEVVFTAEEDMQVNGIGNSNSVKSKEPPQEDFPWPHFASLAMHNLISHWDIQPAPKITHEVKSVKVPIKASGMKKFPTNPENCNPVQLLHQMSPSISFNETTMATTSSSCFEASCKMNGVTFKGRGTTKKAAKRESAIAAIKYVWGFDFHSVEKK